MAELQRGVVKWFNDAKGFGFIEHTSGRDVFVHYSVIEWDGFKTLKDGEEVHYELSEGDKGLHAAKVVRLVESKEDEASEENSSENSEASAGENSGADLPQIEVTTHNVESEEATVAPSLDHQEHGTITTPGSETVEK